MKNDRPGTGSRRATSTKVKYFNQKTLSEHSKVNTLWNAFDIVIKNWSSILRPTIQEYKTIIMDKNNVAKAIVSFQENRNLLHKNYIIEELMERIAESQSNAHIIIAQNHAYKPLYPDDNTYKTSKLFYETSKEYGITTVNHIIVARNGFHVLPALNSESLKKEYEMA
jgi:DNA repair protein RadC